MKKQMEGRRPLLLPDGGLMPTTLPLGAAAVTAADVVASTLAQVPSLVSEQLPAGAAASAAVGLVSFVAEAGVLTIAMAALDVLNFSAVRLA